MIEVAAPAVPSGSQGDQPAIRNSGPRASKGIFPRISALTQEYVSWDVQSIRVRRKRRRSIGYGGQLDGAADGRARRGARRGGRGGDPPRRDDEGYRAAHAVPRGRAPDSPAAFRASRVRKTPIGESLQSGSGAWPIAGVPPVSRAWMAVTPLSGPYQLLSAAQPAARQPPPWRGARLPRVPVLPRRSAPGRAVPGTLKDQRETPPSASEPALSSPEFTGIDLPQLQKLTYPIFNWRCQLV